MQHERTSFRHHAAEQGKRALALLLTCTITWTSVPAWAQVAAVQNPSGKQPGQQVAANGVPVVDIVAPNDKGLSHNRYSRFDVGPNGLILNNSAGISRTQLGGYIAGNENLGKSGPATLILNEVTSTRSNLLGYTEIAGAKAQLVIANPNGISCDGCGFLNASRVTLATGTPNIGADGALNGFDVRGGRLAIGVNGLDAYDVDRLDLLSRQLEVGGEVWARDLFAAAGSQRIGYDGVLLDRLPAQADGTPAIGIDVAFLGGMYANRIRLIATEAGVGVVSRGTLAAQAGELSIDSNGQLTLDGTHVARDRVQLQAAGTLAQGGVLGSQQGDVQLRAQDVQIAGDLIAAGTADVTASGRVDQRGRLSAGAIALRGGTVQADGQLYSTGMLDLQASGQLAGNAVAYAGGDASLAAAYLQWAGTLQSGGAIALRGEQLLVGGTIDAGTALRMDSAGELRLTGLAQAWRDASLHAGTTLAVQGQLAAQGRVDASAVDFNSTPAGSLSAGGDLVLTADGQLRNDGVLHAGNQLVLRAQAIDNRGAGYALGVATANARDTLSNDGSLVGAKALDVQAAGVESRGELGSQQGRVTVRGTDDVRLLGDTAAATSLDVRAGQTLQLGGTLAATDATLHSGGDMALAGALQARGDFLARSEGALTSDALVVAARDLQWQAGGQLRQDGKLQSGAVLQLSGLQVDSRGVLDAGGDLQLAAAETLTLAGTAQTAGRAALTATALHNDAQLIAAQGLAVEAGHLDNAAEGVLASQADAQFAVGQLDNAGVLQAAGHVRLQADTLTQDNAAAIYAGQALEATIDGLLDNRGQLVAHGDLQVQAGTLRSSGQLGSETGAVMLSSEGALQLDGVVRAAQALRAEAAGELRQAGALQARSVSLQGQDAIIAGGVQSAGALALQAQHTLTLDGRGLAAGDAILEGEQIVLGNAAVLQGDGAITLDGGDIDSRGTLDAGTALALSALGDIALAGTAQAATDVRVDAQGLFDNRAQLLAGGDLSVRAAQARNGDSGVLFAHDDARLETTGLFDNAGLLRAGRDLDLEVGALTQAGQAYAARDLRVSAQGAVDNAGDLIGGTSLDLQAGTLASRGQLGSETGVVNLGSQGDATLAGRIASAGDLTVIAGGALTQAGQLSALENLALTAGGDLQVAGQLVARNVDLHSDAILRQQGSVSGGTIALNASRIEHAGQSIAGESVILRGGSIDIAGTVAVGVDTTGNLGSGGTLVLDATGQLVSSGQWLVGGDLDADASAMALAGSQIRVTGDATLTSGGDLDHRGGDLLVGGALHLDAGGTLDNGRLAGVGGSVQAARLDLAGATLSNVGGQVVQGGGESTALAFARIDNSDGLIASNTQDLTVSTASLVNRGGRIEHAGTGTLTVHSDGDLDNGNGQLLTQGELAVTAQGALRNDGGTIAAAAAVRAVAASLDNRNGSVSGNGLDVRMGNGVDNRGGLLQSAGGSLALEAGSLDNRAGTVQAIAGSGGGDVHLTLAQDLDNSGGLVGASHDLVLDAHNLRNDAGIVEAGRDLSVTARGQLDNHQSGRFSASRDLVVTSTGALLNSGGQLDAGRTLTASGASIDNAAGRIINNGAGTTTLSTGGQLDNRGGDIGGSGAIVLTANGLLNGDGGELAAVGDLTANVASLDNRGGDIYGGGSFMLQRAGATLDNRGGTIKAEQAVRLALGQLYNTGGQIGAGSSVGGIGDVVIDSGSFDGGGSILAQNLLDLTLRGDYTHRASADLASNGTFRLNVLGNLVNEGNLQAVRALQVSASNLTNRAGAGIASADTRINLAGNLDNAGDIAGNQVLQLSGNAISNTGDIIGGNVLIQANTLVNGADLGSATDNAAYGSGLIGSTGDMTLLVRDHLLNRDAHVFSLGDIDIGAARDAAGTLTARTGVVDNLSGSIEADGDIAIAAGTINNARRWLQVATGALTPEEQAAANAGMPDEELLVADIIQAPANATYPTRYEGHAPGTWRSYSVVSREHLIGASAESKIVSGGNIALSGSVTNNASTIAAAGALLINQHGIGGLADAMLTGAEQVANQSLSLSQTVRQSDTKYVVRGVTNDCMQPVGQPVVCYYETDVTELGSTDLSSSYTALAATMSGAQGVAISGADIYNGAVGSDGRRIDGVTLGNSGPQNGLTGRGQQAAQGVNGRSVDGQAGAAAAGTQVATGTSGRSLADVQAQAVGGQLQVQGASGALANIVLPIGGLYRLVGADGSDPRALGRAAQGLGGINAVRGNGPGRRYLIETDPRFVDYNNFISSDYLLDKLGLDPEWTLTRLGDGFYEERLVLDQITQLTGNRYLGDYADGVAQYRALLEAGTTAAGQLQLSLGVGLTADQVASLTEDIVWLVEQEYAGQKVLVPVVYLAGNAMELRDNGALIAGGSVALNASGNLANQGTVRGGDISMTAQDLLNQGSIAGTGSVVLQARGDLLNQGGQINGQNVGLAAGNNLRSEALAGVGTGSRTSGITAGNNLELIAGHDLALSGTTVAAGNSAALTAGNDLSLQPTALRQEDGLLRGGQGTSLEVGNDLLLQAGRDVSINGAQVHAGDDATIVAGRDLSLTPSAGLGEQPGTRTSLTTGGDLQLGAGNDITIRQAEVAAGGNLVAAAGHDLNVESVLEDPTTTVDRTRNGGTRTTVTTTTQEIDPQSLSAGGNLVLSAGNDVNLVAAKLEAGDGLAIAAGNDINSTTLTTVDSQDTLETRKRFKQTTSTTDETVHGSEFTAGGDIALQSGRDINLAATTVASEDGSVGLTAGRDVNLIAEQEQHDASADMEKKKKGFLSSKTTTTHDEWSDSYAVGTSLSGDSVQISAGRDVSAVGATVLAEGDVRIAAGNDINLESAQDTYSEAHSSSQKKSGFSASYSGGVASVGHGKSSSSSQSTADSVVQVASTVASTDGNVVLSAGNQLTIAASDVAAGGNLTLAAKDIELLARQDVVDTHASQSSKSSGFSLGVTVNAIEAYQSARDATTQNMPDSGSALSGISRTAEGMAAGSRAATTSVVVQGGSQRSNAAQDHSTSDARVSQMAAGGNLTLLASDGSITSKGAQMSAEGNALLLARQDIVFDVAHNLESSSSQDKGKGGSFANNTSGLPFGTYNQKGNGAGQTDTITGTQLSVGGNASLSTTQGDISLTAANVVADGNVSIAAAGDLALRSGQDLAYNASQSDNKAIGTVVISDTERFMGYHTERHSDDSALVSQVASNVGSLGGNVSLSAGGQYSQVASNVVAANDVDITAASIEVLNATEDSRVSQRDDSLKIGVFGRVTSPFIDLINNVDAARESDGRLQTMQGMAAAANAYQAASAVAAAAGSSYGSGALFTAEAGIGVATDSSKSQGQSQVSQGSTISGGGNVSLSTTQGELHIVQGNLSAGGTLSLDSARDLVLEAGQSNSAESSSGHNAGVEVGVGVSVGAQTGVYVYAQASVGSHSANSEGTTWQNTQLAGQTINLSSQGDTTLRGAVGKADTINVDTGGDLTIESLQDTAQGESRQSGAGARVQVSFGTAWSASGNVNSSSASGSFAGVSEQSGLFAGNGGYHVNADNVNLIGGAIASTNADNSELTAQTLTYSDLHNSMDYSASSASLSGGFGSSGNGGGTEGVGAGEQFRDIGSSLSSGQLGGVNGGNLGGGLPMREHGSDASTTYATLTEGRITLGGVTGTAAATGIHTDASSANTVLKDLPDLQKVLADQQAMSAAAGTVMATGQQVAGDLAAHAATEAASIRSEYEKALGKPGTPARDAFDALAPDQQQAVLLGLPAYQAAYEQQQQWGVGGDYSRALQAVTTALVGSVAGQGSTQVAANALAPYAAQLIGDKFDANHGSDPNAAAQLLSHALLGALLAEVNGGSGAGGALAGAGGEMAAKYLTEALYANDPAAIDPETGRLNPNLLPEDKKQVLVALSEAVGAMAGGIAGGTLGEAAVGAGIAENAVQNNFLGREDKARRDALREKAKKEGLTTDESKTLVFLEIADQIGDGLLQKYRDGEELTDAQKKDLSIYLGAYAQQNGVEATQQLILNGPGATYAYPYAGLSEDKREYAAANFTWGDWLLGHDQTANEQAFSDARKQAGYNGISNENFTPTARELAKFLAVYDTLANSAAASAAYLGATAAGASDETRDLLTVTVGQLAQIGASFILPKTAITPIFGTTVAKPGGGSAGSPDGAAVGGIAGSPSREPSSNEVGVAGRGVVTTVNQSLTGITWGKGIQGQGMPFEDYLANQLPAGTRLPPNFKTFDFFNEATGVATSAKTLDTTTSSRVSNPAQVYSSLKSNIDAAANFTGYTLQDVRLDAGKISSREIQVAVPKATTPAQWTQIEKAVQYGSQNGVKVKIIVVDGNE